MEKKLAVTKETATSDANGLASVLTQLVTHLPYLKEGAVDGMFMDLKPATLKRLRKAREKIEEIDLEAYRELIDTILAEASADA